MYLNLYLKLCSFKRKCPPHAHPHRLSKFPSRGNNIEKTCFFVLVFSLFKFVVIVSPFPPIPIPIPIPSVSQSSLPGENIWKKDKCIVFL